MKSLNEMAETIARYIDCGFIQIYGAETTEPMKVEREFGDLVKAIDHILIRATEIHFTEKSHTIPMKDFILLHDSLFIQTIVDKLRKGTW